MTKLKCLIITFMLGMAKAQLNEVSDECTTLKSEKGVCIKMEDCQILLPLINQTKDPSNRDFLRKSFCGFDGQKPKVCCPLESPLPTPNTCGVSNVTHTNILGGRRAELGAWPWMAVLGYQSSNPNSTIQWRCGGTLISTRYVITAAHCMNIDSNSKLTTVRLGELDWNESVVDGASPLDVPVEQIVINPGYNKDKRINDIALLKLKNSITFNDAIQPICLPITSMKHKDLTGKNLFVAGWGKTKNVKIWNQTANTALMEIRIPVMNTAECIKKYSSQKNIINDKMLCAGDPNGGKDSCTGDSGGPLMWREKIYYFLMGIVSRGPVECAQPNNPAIYTNVPSFVDWVVETVIKN